MKISYDDEFRLHAEGEPAILAPDGHSLYAYHGITIPEKYGSIAPSSWKSAWLFEEESIDIKQALVRGLGYRRIKQDFEMTLLDMSGALSLVKIESLKTLSTLKFLFLMDLDYNEIELAWVVPLHTKLTHQAVVWVKDKYC